MQRIQTHGSKPEKESYKEQNKIIHNPTVQEYPVFDSFVFLFFQN